MKIQRHSEEQILYALRQAEGGEKATEVCRKMGISEQTFYTWKRKYNDDIEFSVAVEIPHSGRVRRTRHAET